MYDENAKERPTRIFRHMKPVNDTKQAWYYIHEFERHEGSMCRLFGKDWRILPTGDLELIEIRGAGEHSKVLPLGPFVSQALSRGEEWKIKDLMTTIKKSQEAVVTDSEVKSMKEQLRQRLSPVGLMPVKHESTPVSQPNSGTLSSKSTEMPESSESSVNVEKLKEYWLKQHEKLNPEESIGIVSGPMETQNLPF
jgi:hypothetical protein